MQLFLFRHGDAEDFASSDFQRNLTPKGVEKLLEQGVGLKNSGFTADKIFSSPYHRAFQTAQILSETLNIPLEVVELLGCGCHFVDLAHFLENHTDGFSAAICVGHQPDLGNITYKFTGKQALVHKGSLIHLAIEDWISHGAILKAVYEPQQQLNIAPQKWF